MYSDTTREKKSESAKRQLPASEEARQRMSESHKGKAPWNRGIEQSVETRQKNSESSKGQIPWNKGKTGVYSAQALQQMSESARRRLPATEEMRQRFREMWQDPVYVRRQMKARNVQPNKLELLVAQWLSPLGFQFVGNGALIIAGKCPDFWDGNKKLIELYGDYWHQGQDPQDRIDLFRAEGYDCLVIWERELEDLSTTMERVGAFMEMG